jgi:hypothetical protein
VRGGAWIDGTRAGPLATAVLNASATDAGPGFYFFGFRCAR